MKVYNSFLVRCWPIRDAGGERNVLDVEHIQTGEHRRSSSLADVETWMRDAAQCRRPDPEAGEQGRVQDAPK